MAGLRDYLYGYQESGAVVPRELNVYNTNITTVNNGGRCCQFIVPGDVTVVSGEIWGGGGSGGGGRCCTMGWPGNSGGYITFSQEVEGGDVLTICAGGSGCCMSYGNCLNGFNSYVCKQGSWCVRANGGCYGVWQCNGQYCYQCCTSYQQTPVNTNTNAHKSLCIYGVKGSLWSSNYCYNHVNPFAAGPAMTGHNRIGANGCAPQYGGSRNWGTFPGGGGFSANKFGGGCCCGGPGAGGQVYIVYK